LTQTLKFKDRALTLATRGVLSGVAITLMTRGLIQLPVDVPVIIEPEVIQRIAAGPSVNYVHYVVPERYRHLSEATFILESQTQYELLRAKQPLEIEKVEVTKLRGVFNSYGEFILIGEATTKQLQNRIEQEDDEFLLVMSAHLLWDD